jgi:hypothetical protein
MRCRFAMSLLFVWLSALGCGSDETKPDEPWQVVHRDLPGALLSVWGSSPGDVWSVGGDAGDGKGPMVVHYDGQRWERLDTGTSGDLWWVFGFANGPVFLGGANGRILRYADGKFSTMATPGTNTVYGIWGSAPDDLWAVGGAGATPTGDFAWRFDGSHWSLAAGLPEALQTGATLFKVWGRTRSDVWIVGSEGVLVHHDGTKFEQVSTGNTRTLFTVHGDAEHVFAVGGSVDGVLLEQAGSTWKDITPRGAVQLAGVCTGTGGSTFAVGLAGSVYGDEGAGFAHIETGLELNEDFHGVWVDDEGGVWAVGGDVLTLPLVRGLMIHRGAEVATGL